jgi:hypothetical protein
MPSLSAGGWVWPTPRGETNRLAALEPASAVLGPRSSALTRTRKGWGWGGGAGCPKSQPARSNSGDLRRAPAPAAPALQRRPRGRRRGRRRGGLERRRRQRRGVLAAADGRVRRGAGQHGGPGEPAGGAGVCAGRHSGGPWGQSVLLPLPGCAPAAGGACVRSLVASWWMLLDWRGCRLVLALLAADTGARVRSLALTAALRCCGGGGGAGARQLHGVRGGAAPRRAAGGGQPGR